MLRKFAYVGVGLIALGGIYVALPTIGTLSALVLTGCDILFASKTPAKTEMAVAVTTATEIKKTAPPDNFADKFSNSLMILSDGKPVNLEPAKLAGIKYWAFYYAASTESTSRGFTPGLVSFYREFKAFHPEFELIFVDLDASENAMMGFVQDNSMPWPSIWYADIDNSELESKKYLQGNTPCLVLVDEKGRVLTSTWSAGKYVDPHDVLEDFRAIVK